MIDESAFNFDAMKEAVGVDPFAETTNKYAKDERFYTLAKDKEGNGAALVRLLPDSEKTMIQKLFKINTTVVKNGKKRFVSEFSPSTIGLPDPFQEEWQRLWNEGLKEEAKLYSRGITYVVNFKVLKDPANPENEGKIFMYQMSGALKNKIQNAVDPSEQDRALGATSKEMFNPLKGNSFRLVAKRGANGQINYDSSEVVQEVTSIYETVEEAIKDIQENTYKLSDLLKPEAFFSYDELVKKKKWVFSEDEAATTAITTTVADEKKPEPEVTEGKTEAKVETVIETPDKGPAESAAPAEVPETPKEDAPVENKSLDSLLEGLV